MNGVANSFSGDWAEDHRGEIVGPIESGHQRDGLRIVSADYRDLLLNAFLPGIPGHWAELVAVGGRLIEKLVEHHGVVAGVMPGHRAPEIVGLLLGGLVHRILKDPRLQIADRMPVQNDIHLQLGTPADGLIEQLGVFRRGALPPCGRVHRDPDKLGAHLLDLDEMGFAPMPLHFELIRVRDGHAAEQHRVPGRVHELVALD